MAGTRNVDIMLSRDGIYVAVGHGYVLFLEVEGGRCYQLTLDRYERDGELNPGGWILELLVAIHGPFARAVRAVA